MSGSPARASLRRLAASFRDDREWIRAEAAAMTAAIHGALPELAADDQLRAQTYASIEAVIRQSLEALAGGADAEAIEPPPAAVAYARELARRGISVDTLLRAYHIGACTWFERWAATVHERFDDPRQASLALEGGASWSMAFVSALSRDLVVSYGEERERWLRSAAAVRADTVRALLAGEPVDPAAAERRLGYLLERDHLALALWNGSSEQPADPAALERAATGLAESLGAGRPLLVPLGAGLLAAWVGSRAAIDADVVARLRLAEGDEADVLAAVGAPAGGLTGFRQSHLEAMQARRVALLADAGPGSVTHYPDVSLVALASADAALASAFVERELGPLASPEPGWRTLATTLLAYLEQGSSPRRAALRLGVHENTVKNRVRAARDVLPQPLEARAPELLVALRLAPLLRAGERSAAS